MKKSLLLSVILILSNLALCQSFVQENKVWNVINCMNFAGCSTTSYQLHGDTILDQLPYKKLYAKLYENSKNWNLCGAMREDENQVYYSNFDSVSLLYDFNLNIGDVFSSTLYTFDGMWETEFELILIDSITLLNGELRKRYTYTGLGVEEYWIEGIGSLCGPIHTGINASYFDIWWNLSCYHFEDEQIYQNPQESDCYVNTTKIDQINNKLDLLISPNPFSEFTICSFKYEPSHKYHIHIVNKLGQVVCTKENITSGEIKIPRNQLESGLYFIHLFENNRNSSSTKLIIR